MARLKKEVKPEPEVKIVKNRAKSMSPENRKRRYYLHAQLKKQFRLDVKNRTMFLTTLELENKEVFSDVNRKQIKELMGFGYMCQLCFA